MNQTWIHVFTIGELSHIIQEELMGILMCALCCANERTKDTNASIVNRFMPLVWNSFTKQCELCLHT